MDMLKTVGAIDNMRFRESGPTAMLPSCSRLSESALLPGRWEPLDRPPYVIDDAKWRAELGVERSADLSGFVGGAGDPEVMSK